MIGSKASASLDHRRGPVLPDRGLFDDQNKAALRTGCLTVLLKE
jgi:hypothetical protein